MRKLTILSDDETLIEELLEIEGYLYTVEYVPSRFDKADFLGEVYSDDTVLKTQFTLFNACEFSSVIELLETNAIQFSYKIEEEVEVDYQKQFEDEYPVTEVGKFLILPPWKDFEAEDKTKVIIAPSMGFGTGQSPTTQLCLEWMSTVDFTNQSVLDFGSGSGILAIAAAKSGAKSVLALEVDEDACKNIEENSQMNQTNQIITLNQQQTEVDCLLMNVTYDILLAYFDSVWEKVKKQGFISGITKEQLPLVQLFFDERNITYQVFEKDMWCGFEVLK